MTIKINNQIRLDSYRKVVEFSRGVGDIPDAETIIYAQQYAEEICDDAIVDLCSRCWAYHVRVKS